jgi:hypothetical protein
MIRSALKWERIEQEISKCEVRCANCHRIRSFEDRPCYRSVGSEPLERLVEVAFGATT